tara:strand:+ start:96 stop:290 length:195 start_codon:yes stop_codon:yes gene_type:complete
MVECKICGNEVSPARAEIVGKLCLDCGEEQASKLSEARKEQTAPIFNKGGYQYITEMDLLDLGR